MSSSASIYNDLSLGAPGKGVLRQDAADSGGRKPSMPTDDDKSAVWAMLRQELSPIGHRRKKARI
jgi:hypothetical protein